MGKWVQVPSISAVTDTDIDTTQAEKDAHEAATGRKMGKAVVLGFVIGTPITFAFFFLMMLFVADIGFTESLLTAIWVALVGGGFYGGISGLLAVLNKEGH